MAGNGGKRAANEVRYYDQEGGDPYGMNITRLDSAGGWLATPADIVRFATHVDGFSTDGNILKPETIAVMTSGTEANPHYAKGWEVNGRGTWWHIGDLPGSSAVLVRTSAGCCGAACMNTRRMQPDIRVRLDHMVRENDPQRRQFELTAGGPGVSAGPSFQDRGRICPLGRRFFSSQYAVAAKAA